MTDQECYCEFPNCTNYFTLRVLGIGLCWEHRDLMEEACGKTIRKLMNDIATEGGNLCPPTCNGVHDGRDE